MPEIPTRKNIRLRNYDYSSNGTYFVTVCVTDKKELLSKVILKDDVPTVELTSYGVIADDRINAMKEIYDGVKVEKYVIMPNHIHLLISIQHNFPNEQSSNNANSSISSFIGTFKRFTNKAYGFNIWQSRFYDHIIRNEYDYKETYKYIDENPIKWYYKHEN